MKYETTHVGEKTSRGPAPSGLPEPFASLQGCAVWEFLKFSAVGLSGVGVNLGFYLLLTRGWSLSMYLAAPLSIESSVLSNFMLNDVWTFRHRGAQAPFLLRLSRFHAVCALGGVVNYLVLLVIVAFLGWSDVLANLAGICAGVAVTFTLHSAWTWRERSLHPLRGMSAVDSD